MNEDSDFFVSSFRNLSYLKKIMNKKQKLFLSVGLFVIIISFILWAVYGFEIFTKTQVLVETKDELFGWSEKKWSDKFIWGLDLSLIISGITTLICGLLFYFFRNKKKIL